VVLSQLYLDKMKFRRLLERTQVVSRSGVADAEILGVTHDSRKVREGYLFVALRGSRRDGVEFVQEALNRGAVAVIAESSLKLPAHVCFARVADARRALADVSCAFFEDPARYLQLIGVTGTNGKTTVSFLVKAIMQADGRSPGLLGTVQYEIGQRLIPASRTTPEAPELQNMLRQMLVAGCRSAVMEVSSHALVQKRIWGIDYDVAVFTNLTEEHLDFHRDMGRYFAAKAQLFSGLGHQEKKAVAVINLDDEWSEKLLGMHNSRVQEITYGLHKNAQVRAEDLVIGARGTAFTLHTPWGDADVELPLMGRYNVSNALAACAACGALGIGPVQMAEALGEVRSVPGRLEEISNDRGIQVFVDYAHTADALQNVLRTLREFAPARIITVFGCGGDRDRTKRAAMGRISARLADHSIITTDNARTEDPQEIADEILAGFDSSQSVDVILDRREAMAVALAMAQPQDIILIAGKGHENYQEIGHSVMPFDDREVVRALLEAG
jgi:UDP-N-acetylmuramoyl-L-alanyl-D-glutamate--2,6-diaminopimelate ligase